MDQRAKQLAALMGDSEAQQRLREIAQDYQTAQLKKLKETSEKEKKELQKILDRKRHNSISEAKSRERSKKDVELTEINRRHITESVNSIRRKKPQTHTNRSRTKQKTDPKLAQAGGQAGGVTRLHTVGETRRQEKAKGGHSDVGTK
ncbi:hypothetical protein L345_15273, partial [Ophiophagus hannah]